MEFNIYQTIAGNLVSSAVKLLEKTYISGKKGIFFSPITERMELVNKALWTFSTNSFIPHGDKKIGFEDQQPIYFTDNFVNPNGASVLVLVDTFDLLNKSYENFEKIILIFEDVSKIDEVNELYRDLKADGKHVNYWKQSQKGWEKLS
ncbi:MAG: DNA polymerase III subunit chi [Alphaproteobacteria bacterium]|nr:DNA polymerase III subunit chi [Alphaproteobacteria bacterium]